MSIATRELLWSPTAWNQLQSAHRDMVQSASFVAGAFVERWLVMVEEVLRYPDIGPRLHEWNPREMRQRVFGGYRLIYEVTPEAIHVLVLLEPDAVG